MGACRLCDQNELTELLDLGMQPVSNRFLSSPKEEEHSYPMVICQCLRCGLIQIGDPVPAAEISPRYNWITYNEPEAHLDKMTDAIIGLTGIDNNAGICGISFKDDSTLRRFKTNGFKNTWRIDPRDDLGIKDSAGLGIIQEAFTPEAAREIIKRRGKADLVIARHFLEHVYDTKKFIIALKELINPGGYVVFEVPDCTRALLSCDYTTLWEEHILYFTQKTFRDFLNSFGFLPRGFERYESPSEDLLMGVAQVGTAELSRMSDTNGVKIELERAEDFAKKFPALSYEFKNFFLEYRRNRGKIALFGAGHLACVFINLFGLKDIIEFCIDDNPNKSGMFMPGSRLPIYASSALIKENIKLCLLGLNLSSEDKVLRNNKSFVDHGGKFLSIFSESRLAAGSERKISRNGSIPVQ